VINRIFLRNIEAVAPIRDLGLGHLSAGHAAYDGSCFNQGVTLRIPCPGHIECN